MSEPNTYIKPSPIHGLGLFAMVDIPAGSEIIQGVADWSFIDEWIKYTKTHKQKSYQYHYGFCMINHDMEPNTQRGGDMDVFAMRDIKAGEEITEDYYKLPDEQNPFIGGLTDIHQIIFTNKGVKRLWK